MDPGTDIFEKAKTKFPKELHHVLDKVAHSCPAFCRVWKLGSYVVGSVDSLAGAEGAFDLIPVPYGFAHVLIELRGTFLLRRPSKRLAVSSYFHIFQHFPVCQVHVDLVCENGCRKKAETFFKESYVQGRVRTFIVDIPTVMVYEGVTFIEAHAYFRPEFSLGLCLVADDWTYVRLEDADNAVGTCMDIIGEHFKLLMIHVKRSVEYVLFTGCQTVFAAFVIDEQSDDASSGP